MPDQEKLAKLYKKLSDFVNANVSEHGAEDIAWMLGVLKEDLESSLPSPTETA